MKKIGFLFVTMALIWSLVSCNDLLRAYSPQSASDGTAPGRKVEAAVYNTIRFETNGGTYVSAQSTTSVSEAPYTERDGYLFEGWYRDATFTQAVIYPISVDTDMTIYAKWLKLKAEADCTSTTVKLGAKSGNTSSYSITPNGFDMDRLEKLGFSMRVTVSYDVSYSKDYDGFWDIGLFGAPRYEVSILNSDLDGECQQDVKAPQLPVTREISYTASIADIRRDTLKLTFSTNNMLNTIHFYNVHVTYECIR